jgi:RNA 2',3'-cyclic 3'-phosphodiesterase
MSDAGPWRCFLAVPLPDDLRATLATSVERWRDDASLADLRWASAEGWHLTLAFLGDTDPERVEAIGSALARVVERHDAWSAETGGVGAFPAARRARVLWYGVSDPDRRLAALAGDVKASLGIAADERFRGHVTLARARRAAVDVRGWIARATAPPGELRVDRLALVRSRLGAGPARYETLADMALGGAPDA